MFHSMGAVCLLPRHILYHNGSLAKNDFKGVSALHIYLLQRWITVFTYKHLQTTTQCTVAYARSFQFSYARQMAFTKLIFTFRTKVTSQWLYICISTFKTEN